MIWFVTLIYQKIKLCSRNLLEKGIKICSFCEWQHEFQHLFSQHDNLVYCIDVNALLQASGQQHKSEEWRLFVDASKLSLKAHLLHNGNEFHLLLSLMVLI